MGVLQVGTLKYLEKIISISFSHLLNTNTSPASNSSSIASFRLLLEIIMSNQGVDHVIEKKKTNHVMVVFNKVEADNKLEVGTSKVRPSRSGAMTAISTARRSLAPIDVQRADRCDDRCNESIGRYDRYSPTVTQGVVAGLRPNWYNLF
ncbi:hypothetical protein L249_7418 [Ophiocordyceps polyrhachis-furcata BCC 54312]|uniref:Uncharacterized protein n=1 Tax=Ophiocordyceps polyrhachis-furcata BCC 54312 TaxID=1330021 RepID=A0A367LB04_9HYPO|nr:hypothetical protein L249_7418 [Ophiocordyceps polyrhachis-furcata BCC 54312]